VTWYIHIAKVGAIIRELAEHIVVILLSSDGLLNMYRYLVLEIFLGFSHCGSWRKQTYRVNFGKSDDRVIPSYRQGL
jgi:hypothetical protein